ncbi:hypothetical protein VTO73DRAFT_7967 [Trametes versicolor]
MLLFSRDESNGNGYGNSRVPPHGSQISEAEKYWIVPDPTFVRLPWLEFSSVPEKAVANCQTVPSHIS